MKALPGYRLRVRLNDASEDAVDLSRPILGSDAGVFTALRGETLFRQAHVALGAVSWPGEFDLAPDAIYRAIRERGEWILS